MLIKVREIKDWPPLGKDYKFRGEPGDMIRTVDQETSSLVS